MNKEQVTKKAHIYGIVQGVGFRPTVSRHAMDTGVKGSVCNMGPYVEVYAQGSPEQVKHFLGMIEEKPPRRAVILRMDVEDVPETEWKEYDRFEIIESGKVKGEIFVSPDIAICEECKKEMYEPGNPRYLHPFINCTCCGPRLTILDAMPYDRSRTSMAEFPMCDHCAWEYTHPETRRYDAQPVCCNDCGPEVYLIGRKERGPEAIRLVRSTICQGGIVAIKGIGGFHLCCDATNEEAVMLLRNRKKRPRKPFAVMMKNTEVVERECLLEEERISVLEGHQKPILLLPKKEEGTVAPSVAPDNPKIGVMLPYAPIHMLLFEYEKGAEAGDGYIMPDCLVMTSANTSGAPICRDDEDAIRELSGLCDLMLSHNRLIRLRADDSVMDFFEGRPYMIRRSRGYAPLPFMVHHGLHGEVLGIGGELKNTFCVGKEELFYPSPYIGDMGDLRTVKALEESVIRMEELLESMPELIVCDKHPSYNTAIFAKELSERTGIPLITVQHHYAHVLSCMAENNLTGTVLGISFDGTGYGEDGTIWGGECMIAGLTEYKRAGSIEPFLQVGGDASAREGWRIAVSLLYQLYGKEEALKFIKDWGICREQEANVIMMMAARKMNAVESTSCGRLFDAVSALLGICRASTFEGEASTSLEFAAEEWEAEQCETGQKNTEKWEAKQCETGQRKIEQLEAERRESEQERGGQQEPERKETGHMQQAGKQSLKFDGDDLKLLTGDIAGGRDYLIPSMTIVKHMVEGRKSGKSSAYLAYEFHEELARCVRLAAIYMREQTGINDIVLSGGCYQNQLLLRLSVDLLRKEHFEVYTHHLLPPNDGGICVGQALHGMSVLKDMKSCL